MAEIKVPVGKDETHKVYAHASFWTHELTVTIDDKPHSNNKGFWKWDKSTTVSVGDREKQQRLAYRGRACSGGVARSSIAGTASGILLPSRNRSTLTGIGYDKGDGGVLW